MLVLGCGISTLPLDLAADGFAVTATDIAPAAIERMRARASALVRPRKGIPGDIKRVTWHAHARRQGAGWWSVIFGRRWALQIVPAPAHSFAC